MDAVSTWAFSGRTSGTRSLRLCPYWPHNSRRGRARKFLRSLWLKDRRSSPSRRSPRTDCCPSRVRIAIRTRFSIQSTGQNTQLCVQPHIRHTRQQLPTLDAWNATVQRQVTNTISVEVAYIGNKGTHVFAGDGPTYNVNNPSIVGYCNPTDPTCSASTKTPQNYRRPYYNQFTYSSYPDPTNTAANFPGAPRLVPGVLQCCSTDQNNYLGSERQ